MADAPWENRIVGAADVAPQDLLEHPRNWRIHGELQARAVSGLLGQLGWVQRVLVNKRSGHVLDGHLRVALALKRQEPTVPVVYVDLDDDEELLVLTTLDPVATMAETDDAAWRTLLETVQANDDQVAALLTYLAEQNGALAPDVDTPEYDERVADDVKYHECPECGHRWPQ